jgi:hypothetical protein
VSDVVGLYRRFGVKLPPLSDGWATTRCFAGGHRDRHPSARVHLRSGGFRCFTCGARGGVLDALQLLGVYDRDEARRLAVEHYILDPPRRPIPPRSPPPPPPVNTAVNSEPAPARAAPDLGEHIDYDTLPDGPTVTLDRAWEYHDRNGEIVGRVRRQDIAGGHKRIWQERPDGDSWAPGLNGAHLPLYRLPLVLERAAAADQILIVEGEKAVDALDRIGWFATTNAGGAGKWRDEHTAALTGATALVLCDCDAPGRLHAYHVTLDLASAGIQTLIPYDPAPLRRDGYDVVDQLGEVAVTLRAVTPDITDATLRAELHHYLRRLLTLQLLATAEALQRWHEHAVYLTDPAGRAYIHCPRCNEERVHRVSHGIAFCRCGTHQPVPA